MSGGERLKRALSVSDLLSKQYELFEFENEWYQAFGHPEKRGVWFVWGNSGNGKTGFILQLIKELCRFERVIFDSLEEGDAHTLRKAFEREGMAEVRGKLIIVNEGIEHLDERLSKRKSPRIAVIDSYQYSEMSFKEWLRFKHKHAEKLLIVVSQADGKRPMGRAAVSVMYDAGLKVWIEGYRAFSKGRYIGPNGGIYTIYKEGAALYHGTE